jgi:hypothetical protein
LLKLTPIRALLLTVLWMLGTESSSAHTPNGGTSTPGTAPPVLQELYDPGEPDVADPETMLPHFHDTRLRRFSK